MSDKMQNLLECILETSEQEDKKYGKVAEVQIQWEPGIVASGGVLRRHELAGFYCLASVAQAQQDGSGFRAGENVLIEQIFEPSAVQRVTRTFSDSGISIVGPDAIPKAPPS